MTAWNREHLLTQPQLPTFDSVVQESNIYFVKPVRFLCYLKPHVELITLIYASIGTNGINANIASMQAIGINASIRKDCKYHLPSSWMAR